MSAEVEKRLAAQIAAVVATASDCIISVDRESRVLEFNPAAERTFGYRREEILGQSVADFIVPPDLRDAYLDEVKHYLETGESRLLGHLVDCRGRRSNGDVFPLELTVIRIEQPGPPAFMAFARDLTERNRFENVHRLLLGAAEILAASLDYEETLRNLSKVIVPAFADWYAVDILEASGALRRLEVAHRDPEKVSLARELGERFPDEHDQPRGVRKVMQTGASELATDIPDELLVKVARSEEHLRIMRQLGLRSAMVVPLRAGGRVAGAMTLVTAESGRRYDERDLAVANDLARRAGDAIEKALLFAEVRDSRERLAQQAEELQAQAADLEQSAAELEMTVDELRTTNDALRSEKAQAEDARRQADDANRAKSDFLAAMSHELRTPLNAIMGYAQLLEIGVHGPLDEKQREDLRRIDRSAQHLLGLINDILNFAKIEAGRIEFHLQRVALAGVLNRVEELIAPQAADEHLEYRFVNGCKDVLVCADEDKLIQLFVNLASNAVRYTEEGGHITVECRVVGDRAITEVCDTGIGIPADKLTAIFEPFVQVDRSYAGQRQGTGLGLAISRDLARGMGGDLKVKSEVGKGSVFSLELKRET